jgi:hypothetical protein
MRHIEDLVSKWVEVEHSRTFWYGPKTGAQKKYPCNLASFFGSRQLCPGWHKLGSGSAQAKLGFAHLEVRLKQQLLRSEDRNVNCSCRDSDLEFPVISASNTCSQ